MLLLIDSADYKYSTNFTYKLPNNSPPIYVKRYKIRNVFIPNTMYTINDTNNKIYVTYNSVTTTVTLTNGAYSIYDLVSHIQTKLNQSEIGLAFAVKVSDVTAKVTISSYDTFSLLFSRKGTPFKVLGFNNVDYTGASTFTGPNIFNTSTRYLLLKSNVLSAGRSVSDCIRTNNTSNVLMVMPVNGNFGNLLYLLDDYSQFIEYGTTRQLYDFDISLCDEDGNVVDLNNSPFALLFEFE